ncbi:hypothetical protein ISR94_03770 [Candidatus Microgenomates bacterium]|nr:hypothetical protein [Candidatus Microgenomates bacterium]
MTTSEQDPPLVDIKVTNPVTYIKKWWKKIIGNEGMSIVIKVRPITAILSITLFLAFLFGIGKLVLPDIIKTPFFQFEQVGEPTPTPKEESETWKETAYIGTLKYSTSTMKYFLVTSSASEAITLEVPSNLNLSTLVERRIMVIGKYSKSLRVIQVMDAKDMEVLPKSPVPIPTNSPTPKPTQAPTEVPTPTTEPSPSASPTS